MTKLRKTLDILENRLQALIENRVARLFTPNTPLNSLDLSQRVVAAIHDCMLLEKPVGQHAPEIITIRTHPLQAAEIWNDVDLITELKRSIQNAVHQAGLEFAFDPELLVEGQEQLAPNQVEVQAAYRSGNVHQTQMVASEPNNVNGHHPTENAFLIYPDNQVHSLEDHMFTIGSGPENDFQLSDPLVERQHAQLRLIGEHYVIFDLDTLNGTYVNQQLIRQQTLRPGDVITFGKTRIIYGENHDEPVDQTQEYDPTTSGMVDLGDD